MMMTIGLMTALALAAAAATQTAPAPAAGVKDLAWLAGCWSTGPAGDETMECWSDPAGGMLLGFGRALKGGRAVFHEFFRIVEDGGAPTYFALIPGQEVTPFRLVRVEGRRFVFENLQHDFPQRVIYERGDDGTLLARTEGMRDGELRSQQWSYRSVPLSQPTP